MAPTVAADAAGGLAATGEERDAEAAARVAASVDKASLVAVDDADTSGPAGRYPVYRVYRLPRVATVDRRRVR